MKILLFPTRFYPAISGGDFYMQRIGEEMKNILKTENNENSIIILTTNAIDFAAIKGNGKIIDKKHKNFSEYRGNSINRLKCLKINQLSSRLKEKIKRVCNIDSKTIDYFFNNGPILDGIDDIIDKWILGNDRPDIIHCTYLPYANLIYSLLIGKTLKIPTIVTPFLHEENSRYQNDAIFDVLKEFDLILACTEYEKQKLIEKGINAHKIIIQPMGIDIEIFNVPYIKKVEKIYPSIVKPIILFCGYKNYEKGALTLLKSIPILSKNLVSFTVVFIGPSTIAFNYKLKKIKKKVSNCEILNITPDNLKGVFDKKKIGLFQIADIYCMPSRSEAYGIAYLEAWATNTPVIASNFPAMNEVVKNEEDGVLVPFDKKEELANEILYLLNNSKIREKMGKKGYQKVMINNNWNAISKNILQLYKKKVMENSQK